VIDSHILLGSSSFQHYFPFVQHSLQYNIKGIKIFTQLLNSIIRKTYKMLKTLNDKKKTIPERKINDGERKRHECDNAET